MSYEHSRCSTWVNYVFIKSYEQLQGATNALHIITQVWFVLSWRLQGAWKLQWKIFLLLEDFLNTFISFLRLQNKIKNRCLKFRFLGLTISHCLKNNFVSISFGNLLINESGNYLTDKYFWSNYKLHKVFLNSALFNDRLWILRLQKFIVVYPAQNAGIFNQSKVHLYQRVYI